MTSTRTTFRAVSRDNPCPVCGGGHKCSRGADGLIVCGRPPDACPGEFVDLGEATGDPQFRLYRQADDPVLREREEQRRRDYAGQRRSSTNGAYGEDGAAERPDFGAAAAAFAERLTPALRDELAEALGLPPHVLSTLTLLGWDGSAWTIPQTDARGRVTNLVRRGRNGSKISIPGGTLGVVAPAGWRERPGPLYLPEGASDALAFAALDLPAIGRPSNRAGVKVLAELLRDWPAEREIVVVAEMDPKITGAWPGLEGAKATAERLAEALKRDIYWALPPQGSKDVRDWVIQQQLPPSCADSWSVAGEQLAAHFAAHHRAASPKPSTAFAWQPIDSAAFARNDYRRRWLVKRVLVEGQPALAGGAKKMLKTSLFVDLAVSLAAGVPFLGAFDVPRPARVCLVSGESGEHTLQETARRVAAARGVALEEIGDRLLWQFRLPQLGKADHLDALRKGLGDAGTDVLIFDPLYLALLSGQGPGGARAENLFDMGPLLLGIAQVCLDAKATPVLIHHTRKGAAASHEPLDLDDLAYAGVAEFARQWLLLSRREKYAVGSGSHKLWFAVGGSAGHGGLWAVDVEEGQLDEDFSGRKWEVAVATSAEARGAEQETKRQARQERSAEQDRADDALLAATVDRLSAEGGVRSTDGGPAAGSNCARDLARLSGQRMARAVDRLVRDGVLERCRVIITQGNNAKREVDGLRRCRDSDG